MHVLLMLNPASGSAPDRNDLTARLRAEGATVTDDEAAAARVVVAGGDGSIAPAAARAADLGVPLAVIPAGTANDFARAHGLPDVLEDAVALAASADAGSQPLELALIGDRPFVNVASAGLAPAAAEQAEPLKGALGPVAYAAGAALAGAREEPFSVVATADGAAVFDGEAWQVTIASSGAFGGGAEIADADPRDGRLDLVIVPETSRAALPKIALAMRRGTLAQLDDVVHARAAEIELRLPADAAFNVDGELVELGSTVRCSVRPGAFSLVVPAA